MAKVTVLQSFRVQSEGKTYNIGDTAEFDDRRADYYVRMGRVTIGDAPKKTAASRKKKADCTPCAKKAAAKEAKAPVATKELKEETDTK